MYSARYSVQNTHVVKSLDIHTLEAIQGQDLIVLDNTENEFTIEEMADFSKKIGNQTKLLIHIRSTGCIGYNQNYNHLIENKNIRIVHTFPAYTKLELDSPAAVLLAHPE